MNGVSAEDEFVGAQVGHHFVVPVFDRHRLPLIPATFPSALAKVSGHDPRIAIDRRVELEMIEANLGDAVVSAAAAGHEPKVCRLARELEVELDDRVVERRVFEEDSFGFARVHIRAQQCTVAQSKIGFEAPTLGDGFGVEAFREQKFSRNAHQSTG